MGIPKLIDGSSEVQESEKKRLQSLKEKKRAFKAKEKAVQDALKDFGGKPRNNKIIFDEDIDQITESKPQKNDRIELFDNEDEESEDGLDWDSKEFEAKKKKQSVQILGTDERFKLDERFREDESDSTADEDQNEGDNKSSNLEEEKQQQLGILESILGAPVVTKKKDVKVIKPAKKGMIRYDPTANDHQEYEITAEKPELVPKKIKKKKEEEKEAPVTETAPVVSKEIYFSVSKSLSKSFAEKEQFSLLKTFKNEEILNENNATENVEQDKPKKFQFNFDTKNPFKYDSSDNEDQNENEVEDKGKEQTTENESQNKKNIFGTTDRFFFDSNDARFNEAIQFFSKETVPENEFQSLRRELKQIVRAKIRNNLQKTQPWGKKRKVKRQS